MTTAISNEAPPDDAAAVWSEKLVFKLYVLGVAPQQNVPSCSAVVVTGSNRT